MPELPLTIALAVRHDNKLFRFDFGRIHTPSLHCHTGRAMSEHVRVPVSPLKNTIHQILHHHWGCRNSLPSLPRPVRHDSSFLDSAFEELLFYTVIPDGWCESMCVFLYSLSIIQMPDRLTFENLIHLEFSIYDLSDRGIL